VKYKALACDYGIIMTRTFEKRLTIFVMFSYITIVTTAEATFVLVQCALKRMTIIDIVISTCNCGKRKIKIG